MSEMRAIVSVESMMRRVGVVPVVVLDETEHAAPLAHALLAGGLPVAEVTLRTTAAMECIREMSAIGELLVGAGTVISVAQVDQAVEAGAQFVVCPGLSPEVVKRCQERGIPVFPGVVTPSEIMQALDLGQTTCKFFPASTYGGPSALRSLGAPFREVQFIPTGGVKPSNVAEYLSLENVIAVGGTWIVKPDLVRAGKFELIKDIANEAATLADVARRNA